ncbi:MAG: hypothetical protein DHS20C18_14050 [Saprospiraceae bacterium]|nr:MAG: hypothetical protein DHS20C18_14050 [Saprospiraceae bacterium]
MKKLYLLFPITLITFFAVLFFSFMNAEVSFEVEGFVVDSNNQPIYGADVILDKDEVDGVRYFEPTKKDGSFHLQFNAKEGKPLEILIKKEQFLEYAEKIIPSTSKRITGLVIKLAPKKTAAVQPASAAPLVDQSISSANK